MPYNSAAYGEHWKGRDLSGMDLENFRNNGMSSGLDGFTKVGDLFNKGPRNNRILSAITDIVVDVCGEKFFDHIYTSGVGNPPFAEYKSKQITHSDICAVYNLWLLMRYVKEAAHIVEIGPGFGALAANIRRVYPDTYITLVDLPEHHKMQRYYLENTVGMDGFEITSELPDDADVVVALRCMMEMTNEEVAKYLDWIQTRPSMRWCYVASRYIKRTMLKEYPFDDLWFPRVSQEDVFMKRIHELMLQRVAYRTDELAMTLETLPPYKSGKAYLDKG